MSRVEIEKIVLPRDTTKFVRTWWRVYEDDPHWVPPLLFERKRFFNPRINPYFNVAQVQCFRALKEGEPVGTISVVVDRNYQREDPGTGFFGFFEFIDDHQVSQALFEAGCQWLNGSPGSEACCQAPEDVPCPWLVDFLLSVI